MDSEQHGFAKLEIPFFPCDICEESFTDERELTQHVNNSHRPGETRKRLNTKQKANREETINLHCCSTCGKGYRYFAAFKRHQLTHSGGGDINKYHKPRKIKCRNKDMVTIVKRRGNNARRQENKRPVMGQRPGKRHARTPNIQATPADKKTSRPRESPYRCLDSGKDFKTFTACQRHQTDHTNGQDLARIVQEGTREVSEAPTSSEPGDTRRREEEDVGFHVTSEDADLTSNGNRDNETETSKYSCLDCGRIFKRFKCYQKHCETHKKPLDANKEETNVKKQKPNTKGNFCCPVCGRAFNKRTILTKHKQIYHSKDSSVAFTTSDPLRTINHKQDLRCCECDRYFDDQDTFTKHKCYHLRKYLRAFLAADRVSKSGDVFYCQLCILTFSDGRDFEIHIKKVHVEEYNKTIEAAHKLSHQATSQKKEMEMKATGRIEVDEDTSTRCYTCQVCGAVLKDFYSLRRHRETHIKAAQLYHCEICGRDFGRSDHLKRHSYIHSATAGSFTCSICGVKFTNPRKLQSHKKLHLVKSHACQVCGKQYVLKRQLDFHHETAHPGPEGYSCYRCSKTFSDIEALRRHRRTHLPHRHSCVHCGKAFRRPDKLRQHQVLHTDEKPEKPHLCDHCGTMFARRDHLREHVEMHQSKSFLCALCGKRFNNRQSFRRHNVAHKMGSRGFHCEDCGKSFSRKDHLKRHSHQHCASACPQRRKVFSCKDCGKSFRRKEGLKQHSHPLCASALTLAHPQGRRVTFQSS